MFGSSSFLSLIACEKKKVSEVFILQRNTWKVLVCRWEFVEVHYEYVMIMKHYEGLYFFLY